ncbi:hypothetical protein PENTCL1PPCAC_23740 [Pristionchus entomophagus]|uniref:BTB domain-containing protein n=1 Tax=Pristionchus entomophagus TaxID=358040 RepID=A0AAV5U507_9BILA|nr:hypothetical protein PENTCL1PPCAC_23740 [Pristionchus entomophagus]
MNIDLEHPPNMLFMDFRYSKRWRGSSILLKDLSKTTLLLWARINIKSCSGNRFRSKVDCDFFSPSLSDAILVVEDKEFHVRKQWLAIQSSYFKSLFFGNFNEASQQKINQINPVFFLKYFSAFLF